MTRPTHPPRRTVRRMPDATPTTHLHIDPFSGIAGDMFLGAAIDLGADRGVTPAAVTDALRAAGLEDNFSIDIDDVLRHGLGAKNLTVRTPTHAHAHHHHHHGDGDNHGHHHHHHHSTRDRILGIADKLDLTPRGRARATTAVNTLAEAEARVHRTTPDKIHFHEVGAVDSIVDLLGSVLAMDLLNVDTVSCGPLPISSGFVNCEHGLMPVPAPATAYLLEGMPTYGTPRRGELITPTGAALLRGCVDTFGPPPPMTVRAIGYGAGDRETDKGDVPNLLRLWLGQQS